MTTHLTIETDTGADTAVVREPLRQVEDLQPRRRRGRWLVVTLAAVVAVALAATVAVVNLGGSAGAGYPASDYRPAAEEMEIILNRTTPSFASAPATLAPRWDIPAAEMGFILGGPSVVEDMWDLTSAEKAFIAGNSARPSPAYDFELDPFEMDFITG